MPWGAEKGGSSSSLQCLRHESILLMITRLDSERMFVLQVTISLFLELVKSRNCEETIPAYVYITLPENGPFNFGNA